jgi:hypothetical protein
MSARVLPISSRNSTSAASSWLRWAGAISSMPSPYQ